MRDIRGKVLTVLGPIDRDRVGVALTHEHVFCDLRRSLIASSKESESYERLPVSIENLWLIRRDCTSNVDNVQLSDYSEAVNELMLFKAAGGRTLVDVTVRGIGPDYSRLRNVSQATSLNIVAATGYYVSKTHPSEVDNESVDDLAAELKTNITEGFDNTGIRAGILKIGVGGFVEHGTMRIHKNEEKLLRAASVVQKETGVAITVHTPRHLPSEKDKPPSWWGLRILDILEDAGTDPHRVIVGHLDRCPHESLDLQIEIAKRGAYVEYDVWGKEWYFRAYRESNVSDSVRVERVGHLIDEGCLERMLLSQDNCMKVDLVRYGGYGYGHILRNIVPIMRDEGISESEIRTMISENPKRILAIA